MPIILANKAIGRISVVDDDPAALQGYQYVVEDLGVIPLPQSGPLPPIDEFFKRVTSESDAVLCDYHLKTRPYAGFDGDEFVVMCYKNQFPAVLCTTFTDADVTLLRTSRRYIPSLLKPADLDIETVRSGLTRCLDEFTGNFDTTRKPWRTLVRVAEVEEADKYLYVVLPGWNSRIKIRLYFHDLPSEMWGRVSPGARFHAKANIGAESQEELYLVDWEVD